MHTHAHTHTACTGQLTHACRPIVSDKMGEKEKTPNHATSNGGKCQRNPSGPFNYSEHLQTTAVSVWNI